VSTGSAQIFADNQTFAPNVPVANANFLAAFGVTATAPLIGFVSAAAGAEREDGLPYGSSGTTRTAEGALALQPACATGGAPA
jgi:hypothetical protein